MADSAFKIRENRVRRMAERQGLFVNKSRTRDPKALDYGKYTLTRGGLLRDGGISVYETTELDDVEHFLTH